MTLAKTTALPANPHYYRTQVFLPQTSLNHLVMAADPIFSLINKLRYTTEYDNIAHLHNQLAHEIRAFEMQARTQGYRFEIVQAARYALCAFCDEMIEITPWGAENNWTQYKMLTLFQQEISADDRFYLILNRLLEDAEHYIDILELMYICLSLGFKGKYRTLVKSTHEYEKMGDLLYQALRLHRGEFSKILSAPTQEIVSSLEKTPRAFTPWRTLGLFIGFNILFYCGMQYLTLLAANPVLQELVQIGRTITTG